MLAEARGILDDIPDAGMFPKLLECQERKLRARKAREGQLNGELTVRERDVLRLFGGELSTRQMAQSLYVAPSTVRTQIKSVYRKLGSLRVVKLWRRPTPGGSSNPYHRDP